MKWAVLSLLVSAGMRAAAPAADFFVAPNGNDAASGTHEAPFATVGRAQTAVRALRSAHPDRPVQVMVRGGTYYLHATVNFKAEDSGSAAAAVTWQNYPGEMPIFSGGVPVHGWKHAEGSLWQVRLPADTKLFSYLFYNGERRLRPRIGSAAGVGYYMSGGSCYSTATKQAVAMSLCNLGSYLRVDDVIPPTGENAGCKSVTSEKDHTKSKCLDRFLYNPEDHLARWANLNPAGSACGGAGNNYPVGDVEVTLFDAWTVDVLRVSCIDTAKHVMHFTTPAKGNGHVYNFFGPGKGHRYVIENVKDAFEAARAAGQTGLWFLDRSTSPWTLSYLANKGEDPNRDNVMIAQVGPANATAGSLLVATDLKYVTFRGLTFEVDNYVVPEAGFTNDENSDDVLPEAVDCESCQYVTFDGITVRSTSASGILIASTSGISGPPATHDVIQNSAFYDIGDCGIRIGHRFTGRDAPESATQFVRVENNIVQGYSRVFADGEGISLASGHDVTNSHNDITDGYHAAVSICMLGCPSHVANGSNVITEYNHIWNTMQGVTSDGGTLYYNVGANGGSGTGNKILNNLVHDTSDSSVIDVGVPGSGYGGAGIYLDIQSAGFQVANNVVYNVAAEGIFTADGPTNGESPNTYQNNIIANARTTMFRMFTPWPKGCTDLSVRANLLNNIFVFDRDDRDKFYVTTGCAYSCGLDYNQFLNFQGNLYWRADAGFATYAKAFHSMPNPPANFQACATGYVPLKQVTFVDFAGWQSGKMNEDTKGTATVDPKFGYTGKPTDYLLESTPVAGFDPAKTNDTIRHAGRNHPVIMPPAVAHTYPTYTFSRF